MPRKPAPKYTRADEIPEWYITRMSKLRGVVNALDSKYGVGKWGRAQVVEYVLTKPPKSAYRAFTEERKVEQKIKDAERRRETFEERLARLKSGFEGMTYNDEVVMRQMIDLEMSNEELTERLRLNLDEMPPDEINKLSQLKIKNSAEYRQLQASLGIDRATRGSEIDVQDEITRLVAGATEMLRERAIQIVCPKCLAAGRKIDQGYILFHFRGNVNYRWWSKCPHPDCDGEVVLMGEPNPAFDWRALLELPMKEKGNSADENGTAD